MHKKIVLTEQAFERLTQTVKRANHLARLPRANRRRPRRNTGGGGAVPLIPAIAQEAIRADGKLSVKLADANGDVIQVDDGQGGLTDIDPFDVWLFADKRPTITVADFISSDGTEIAAGVKVNVAKDKFGEYYLVMPQIVEPGEGGGSSGPIRVKAMDAIRAKDGGKLWVNYDASSGVFLSVSGGTITSSSGNIRITNAGGFIDVTTAMKARCVFSGTYANGIYNILAVSDDYIDIDLAWSSNTPTANVDIITEPFQAWLFANRRTTVNPAEISAIDGVDIDKDVWVLVQTVAGAYHLVQPGLIVVEDC